MIEFSSESIELPKLDFLGIQNWIKKVLIKYNKMDGDIHFYFCNDDYILKVNKEYLNHDYYTDVITFDYCIDNIVSGEIIISLDTVKSNSLKFDTIYQEELFRVIIHGILHLLGFSDLTEVEKVNMRELENECLILLKTII